MRKTVLVTTLVVFSNVAGNFSLSWGVKHPASGAFALLSPWVVLGVALLIVWTLARMALLSWADLSFVLPVTSAGYVLTALAGKFFLNEQVSLERWAGTVLIMLGVILVGATDPRTAAGREKQP
ncbi:MAG: EamA family transporter [Acidobacteriales bacterium]|nr:EamA family transporter [Terriglobales bacterium]